MADWVLDASAVLAFIQREPGGELVGERLLACAISSVNLAEVASKLVDRGLDPRDVATALGGLGFEVASPDAALALRAGVMRRETRALGLSLGDRFCLALAERNGRPAMTTDRAWARVPLPIQVELLR